VVAAPNIRLDPVSCFHAGIYRSTSIGIGVAIALHLVLSITVHRAMIGAIHDFHVFVG